ncbi:MAG: hypothetical protein KF857_10675 [Fimbriimonadaceae bacterium]|nr:hypothetical protein [Fimbriimonadaceae bacterium]
MAKVKEGDSVRVTGEKDGSGNLSEKLFPHLVGLTGTVSNHYNTDEVAVQVDLDSLSPAMRQVHSEATERLRTKFLESVGEEAKKHLTKEELEFTPHYVLLVGESDLEKTR